jgi:hypothetical protein
LIGQISQKTLFDGFKFKMTSGVQDAGRQSKKPNFEFVFEFRLF